jgi:hypothetical protein
MRRPHPSDRLAPPHDPLAATFDPLPPPLYREHLWPLVWREASAAVYRRTERYRRHCELMGRQGVLPVPAFERRLAVYLSQRLPAALVVRLGPRGLLRAGQVLGRLLRAGAAVFVALFYVARWVRRAGRKLRSAFRVQGSGVSHPGAGPTAHASRVAAPEDRTPSGSEWGHRNLDREGSSGGPPATAGARRDATGRMPVPP